ncbi:MAG: hypothetical protein GTN99_09845 [Candidatus Dadabacteria bacterium]|nr:hypothetical protein [Gammaproteobacteria bacterium]NIT05490.1 hypothetical protein [Gammaproteobacteria bacterium]NIT14518.1 hypothetical protein [Candidatus Dadabacteria bacterium]
MSPKEYTYKNNTHINKSTYSVKTQKKVHTDFKNGIFKTRLYEIYDNLNGIKPLEDVVEEGAYKTIKEIMVNRMTELTEENPEIDIDSIANLVKTDFPYKEIPKEPKKARKFFVEMLCNMVVDSIYLKAESS